MLQTYVFSAVRAAVVDNNKARLQVLRSALYYLGIRHTAWTTVGVEACKTVESTKPDLLIAALETPDADIDALFSKIRAGQTALDPFTPIIAILSDASPQAVRRGIDSGADDIVIHPWPQGYLDQRIEKLIHERKPFVVTSGYIGPERRAAMRPGPQPVVLNPVNSLAAKAVHRMDDAEIEAAQSPHRTALYGHRLRVLLCLTVGLIRDVERSYAAGHVLTEENTASLERLARTTEDTVALAPSVCRDTDTIALLRETARHVRLCRDAQEFGRIASIAELKTLAGRIVSAFKLTVQERTESHIAVA